MAKVTANQWAQARALYEAGESLRDISDKTKIDNSNISKRAKKEGWARGVLPQLADDKARILIEKKAIDEKITALLPHQREIVETAVIDKLALANYFHNAGIEVAEIALEILREDKTVFNAKNTMETLKTGRAVTGLDSVHANVTTINNTVAQQTNVEERKGENGFKLVFEDASHEKPVTKG